MPADERQPKLLRGPKGKVHLIYFKLHEPASGMGNLFYRQYQVGDAQWSNPIQVSSQAYRMPKVIASANLAVDDEGRVHVTWLRRKPTGYMYSRSNAHADKFETERSLVKKYLEGDEAGASVAVNANRVTLSWMVGGNERSRTVYTITSVDSGSSFHDEKMKGDQSLGGCSCCGLSSIFNNKGELTVAYRSATNGYGRHLQLLTVPTKATSSSTRLVHSWEYGACPVSTNNMHQDSEGHSWLALETAGRVYIVDLQQSSLAPILVRDPMQDIRQKHPAIAFNDSGYKVVVWSEGNGYFSGGELQMQLFNPKGIVMDTVDTRGMKLARMGNVAVSSLPEGSFIVLY